MSVRGKSLTYHQRMLLSAYGVSDVRDWLYMGMETTDAIGGKSLSKNQPKEIKMVFENRITGEVKKIARE